ncbi:MAG: hypothetical protein IJ637_00895 [Prevotella sp.]|nr:hypothetical protein [Prevotella sp.]
MRKELLSWVSILLMGFACLGFSACGDDGDGDGGGSSNISPSTLVGWAFQKTEKTYGGNIETVNWYVEFKTTNFAMVHMYGNGIDEDGTYRWDHGEIDCMYTVSGNKVIIEYTNSNTTEMVELVFKNGVPNGWSVAKQGSMPIGGQSDSSTGGGSSSAGSSSMFGFYSNDSFDNAVTRQITELKSSGNYEYSWWKEYVESYNAYVTGYQIIDGNTIQKVYQYTEVNTNGREPVGDKWFVPVVYKRETHTGRSGGKSITLYVFYYYVKDSGDVLKYVVNGSTLELSDGTKLVYNGGKLTGDNISYTKR